jgi:hypothetical protein
MPSKLHNNMVKACLKQIPKLVFTDKDLRHRRFEERKSDGEPDILALDNSIAVECSTLTPEIIERLTKYSENCKNLILCLPIPLKVIEVWVYSLEKDSIIKKLR